jgi:hypothetical protein
MANDTNDLDLVEIVAAVLLGLAAMAIAWSTYQSELWGGQQDEAYTESVRAANNAVDMLQAADTARTLDQSLFVEILTSGVCGEGERGDEVVCQRVLANMSPEGAAAVNEWLSSGDSNPFESPAYVKALYGAGEAEQIMSEQFFEEGGEANENGDNYELASTILTAVLFFAGISLVVVGDAIRWALLGSAGLLLIGATGYIAGLPLA